MYLGEVMDVAERGHWNPLIRGEGTRSWRLVATATGSVKSRVRQQQHAVLGLNPTGGNLLLSQAAIVSHGPAFKGGKLQKKWIIPLCLTSRGLFYVDSVAGKSTVGDLRMFPGLTGTLLLTAVLMRGIFISLLQCWVWAYVMSGLILQV